MDQVLAEYLGKFTIVYIDDIKVYSKIFKNHLEHLWKIFKKLDKAGLKINMEKCKFF